MVASTNGQLPGTGSGTYIPAGGTMAYQGNPPTAPAGNSPIAPPGGETPLGSNPYAGVVWNGQQYKSGSQQGMENQAFQDFVAQFGRNPTQSELSMLAPAYAGDPNVLNGAAGKGQVAAYYNQLQNTPQNIYAQQQNQYVTNAPKYSDQVNNAFQSNLGRAATQDELTHFGALMASGQDAYQVQQALQQTQEYQNTANTKFQNQLQGQLQQSNATYFNQYIAPSIQSQAALAGRSLDSSGVNSQLANAALQQNQGLQTYLAGVTAQNYQNSTANAMNQYQGLMGQQYGLQNANVSSGLANQAANQQYNQNLALYQLQQQTYNNYLQRYGKSGNPALGAIQGGMQGASAGASFGPWGALIGGVAGAGLGAYGQSQGSAKI